MISKTKRGVLLVNLGTPDSPSVPDVKKYLTQFLMDARIIDIPAWKRLLLVRGIIVPFRSSKSAELYQQIWDQETGSPLMYYSIKQKQLLQQRLGNQYVVQLGMRYQSPSIADALKNLKKKNVRSIRVIPLFPHYASATVGSIIEKVMDQIKGWLVFPELSFLNHFYDNDQMIQVFADHALKHDISSFDHFIFSYHGVPKRQLLDVDGSNKHDCDKYGCRQKIEQSNQLCYLAQCYVTSKLIANKLKIENQKFSVCFQSRLGSTPWIQPYTDQIIKQLANKGKKRLLVFSPAFISDCLETLHEISIGYDEQFKKLGGQHIQLVQSLNLNPKWITVLEDLAKENKANQK